MIQSPLNYTGGKFKLLPQILPHFPKNIDTFVDLFCGGCNVGINVEANTVIYNDLNEHLLYFRQVFLYCKVAFQSCGVVQRCEFAVVLEVADYLGGDNHAVR